MQFYLLEGSHMPHFTSARRLGRALSAGAAASVLALTIAAAPAFAQDSAVAKADTDQSSWGDFGIQTQFVDKAVKPGDDFDAYVNNGWKAAHEIPADKTRIGSFQELSDLSEQRLHGILDGLIATPQAPGSDDARIAAAYKAYIDVDAINKAGLAPAQPYLQRIFAARTPEDLVKIFAAPGFASPLGASVDADAKQSDVYALSVGLSGLGLPDRSYYLQQDDRSKTIRAKYEAYLAFLLGKAGYADPAAAAKAVLSLETRMAQDDWDRAASRNRDLTYNKLSTSEFEALGSGDLMKTFLAGMGAEKAAYVLVDEMPPTAEELKAAKIDAAQAEAEFGGGVPATIKLIEQVPVSTWQAWLAASFLRSHAQVLPSEIDDANFDFYGKVLSGQQQQRPRWKRGITMVESEAGELLGKIYAAKYYPPAEKAAMEKLVANLRTAMGEKLSDLSWMSEATRKEALAKLAAFTPKIGEPDKFKEYKGLTFSDTDPLGNMIAAGDWENTFQMNRIGKPVDKSEWFMLPETINAYYNPTFNEIVFPAAILQPPFFNLSADPAVNYGAIGAVIGHEMGHGFDDQGAKSDGQGNLRDWWTAADMANFQKIAGQAGRAI